MSSVVRIPASQLVHLVWCCAKCGKDDGVARSNLPLGQAMDDAEARRVLLEECTRKVLAYHGSADGCDATADDIFFQPREETPAAPSVVH